MDIIKEATESSNLSIYGAITGTIGTIGTLILTVFSVYRDKAGIHIEPTVNYMTRSNSDYYAETKKGRWPLIGLNIINKGRRPISIRDAGYKLIDERYKILSTAIADKPLPYELTEYKSMHLDFFFHALNVDQANEFHNNNKIHYYFAEDTLGRKYKYYDKNLFVRIYYRMLLKLNKPKLEFNPEPDPS